MRERALALALACVGYWFAVCAHATPTIDYAVIARYPHVQTPFTQGFELNGDTVYESSGLYDQSFITTWQLDTARVEQRQVLPARYFAEGLTVWGDRIYVLTWREQQGFIFDKHTLRQIGQFDYNGEGWGLTHNTEQLIASDGSATLRFLDPQSMQVTAQLQVTDNGKPIRKLNELEWLPAHGAQPPRILANIWQTDTVVVIDPKNGHVTARLDLAKLYPHGMRAPQADVLNGIAYDARNNTLLLTGKWWPFVYRVRLERALP